MISYMESSNNKSDKHTGKQSGKMRAEIAGLTLHSQFNQLENAEESMKEIENGGMISANMNLKLIIDGFNVEASMEAWNASKNSQFPRELSSELEVCKDEECETMSIDDEREEIVQKIMSGGKFTITYWTLTGPVNFDLSISGNPNGLILKFSEKSNETFETNFSASLTIEDVGSLKMTLDGSTSANKLMSKFGQFLQIWQFGHGNLDMAMDNLMQDIILVFDDIATTTCIEDNCYQYGVCSEDLCNTQENFIKKANSGVTLTSAFILMALGLLFSHFI